MFMPAELVQATSKLLGEEYVRGGSAWSHVLKRGTALRITDLEGGANAPSIFFNADNPVERYNMPDTLKAQHTAHLHAGLVLYSDMGRVLCSMTHDVCGWHDPISGHLDAVATTKKFGELRYQQARNDFHRNTRDNFLIELEKYGLGLRDLPANVNIFSKVVVADDGSLNYIEGHSKPGGFVQLRAEMNVLVIVDTCQHPLNPETTYRPRPVELKIFSVPPPLPDDPCRTSRPENERGFVNTERYFL